MTEDGDRQGAPYYEAFIDEVKRRGVERLGLMTSWAWYDDPKRLGFTLARYKFVAKMLDGVDSALEIGCSDGFATRVVAQSVGSVTAVDFDPAFIESARANFCDRYPITFAVHDLLKAPVAGRFGAVYSLDVLEHIPATEEDVFLANMIAPLASHGICIIGMPSLESQAYASPLSKVGHVNCKDQGSLRALMKKYFYNVFIFSMNDEVVHTGYHKMSHYNIAVCCGKIE